VHEVIETILIETLMRNPIDAGSIVCNKTIASFMKGGVFDAVVMTMETDADSIAMFDEDEEDDHHLVAYC
jgi:hypothetical protein